MSKKKQYLLMIKADHENPMLNNWIVFWW